MLAMTVTVDSVQPLTAWEEAKTIGSTFEKQLLMK
jgi:hypothetical protein